MTLFLDHGAPIDARDLDGSTALYKAAETGRPAIVRLLVERGANVNLPGRSEATPVTAAAYMGSEPIVKFLIEKGADLNAIDKTKKGALVYAAGRGFPPVARLLLDHGVDVNARYGHGLTALMWAAGHSSDAGTKDVVQVIDLLIDRGARIDDRDEQGRTALMIAAELGHTAAVDLLIARGADRSLQDNEGKTAADLARDDALRAKLAGQIGFSVRCRDRRRSEARRDIAATAAMSSGVVARIRSDMPGLFPACLVAERQHRRLQILLRLAGEARGGAVALEMLHVAAFAADRSDRGFRLGSDIVRCRRLLQIRPFQIGEIGRECQQVLPLQGGRHGRHERVLSGAALEIAQLQKEVALDSGPRSPGFLC